MKFCKNGLLLLLAVVPLAAHAQKSPFGKLPSITQGRLTWDKGVTYDIPHNTVQVTGNAAFVSSAYELHAETLTVVLASGNTKSKSTGKDNLTLPVTRASAAADLAAGKQVEGVVRQTATDGGTREVHFLADHAVFVAEGSRPGGGRIDFTGHVQMTVTDPKLLTGPGTLTAEHMWVLLGTGPDYPQVQGGSGQAAFSPSP